MSELSRDERCARIQELRSAIDQLESELEREVAAAQHEQIDELDRYIDTVENKFSSLQLFWEQLKKEILGKKG